MTKNSFIAEVTFKQTCNLKLQVCLSTYDLLLSTRIKGLINSEDIRKMLLTCSSFRTAYFDKVPGIELTSLLLPLNTDFPDGIINLFLKICSTDDYNILENSSSNY